MPPSMTCSNCEWLPQQITFRPSDAHEFMEFHYELNKLEAPMQVKVVAFKGAKK